VGTEIRLIKRSDNKTGPLYSQNGNRGVIRTATGLEKHFAEPNPELWKFLIGPPISCTINADLF
jgi:hypothetical protein